MIDLERTLRSIGKECFVEFYNDFKNCSDKVSLARKLLELNNKAQSLDAQVTRVNKAKKIFESRLEREALENIIKSDRMSETVKQKAKLLLQKL